MGKTKKRTVKLLKKDGKGLRSRLHHRKVQSTVSRRKAEKVAKFEKSVTEYISKQAEEEEIQDVEKKAAKEAESFVQSGKTGPDGDVYEDDVVFTSDSEGDEVEEECDGAGGINKEAFGVLGEKVDSKKETRIGASSQSPSPSSSSSDSDGGEGGFVDIKNDNKRLEKEIHQHKEELEALKHQDPKLYEYLKQADESLLAFGESESEGDEDEDEDDLDSDQEGPSIPKKEAKERRELTQERAEELCQAAVDPKSKVEDLKLLLAAYHAACIYGQDSEKSDQVLVFKDSSTYTKIMMFVLKEVDGLFWRLLGVSDGAGNEAISKALMSKAAVYKEICQFFVSTMRLLTEPLDGSMCGFVLRRLRASVPLLGKKKALVKKVLLCALGFFASEAKSPRVQAIMLIREMMFKLGETANGICMKGVYRTFASKANLVNPHSAPHLSFMATCVIEIFGLNAEHAYRHAFGFIRNLAIELREAISEKKQESISKVFSWRYINCLELWARLISTHIHLGDMQHLVYPVAQLLLGVIQFRQQKKYLPTRLRVVRTLNGLSAATGFYIPVSSYLLGILQWALQNAKVRKAADDICPDLSFQLKVAKGRLNSSSFQEEVVEQVFELLTHHLAQWSNSIAFPEMTFWISFHIRKFSRKAGVESYRKLAHRVLRAAEECAKNVERRRDVVDFSPKDVEKVKGFEEEGKRLGKTQLECLSLELEKAARRRQDMRSKAEWTMDRDDSSPSDSHHSDEDLMDDGSVDDDISAPPLGTSKDNKDQDSQLPFIVNRTSDDVEELSDSDVVEEFVLSDDENPKNVSRKSNEEKSSKVSKEKKGKFLSGVGKKRIAAHRGTGDKQRRKKRTK